MRVIQCALIGAAIGLLGAAIGCLISELIIWIAERTPIL